MDWNAETLRFPMNLDRAAIVALLGEIRERARTEGLATLASALEGIEAKAAPQIGVAVVSALSLVKGADRHDAIAKQLEIVAVNLKNLK